MKIMTSKRIEVELNVGDVLKVDEGQLEHHRFLVVTEIYPTGNSKLQDPDDLEYILDNWSIDWLVRYTDMPCPPVVDESVLSFVFDGDFN